MHSCPLEVFSSPVVFSGMTRELPTHQPIKDARVLLFLGDSVTTDHISPAGSIGRTSPAARYLAQRGLTPREFNSYGSRRGNDAVMMRGTFANIRLVNKFMEGKVGPKTIYLPTNEEVNRKILIFSVLCNVLMFFFSVCRWTFMIVQNGIRGTTLPLFY